MIVAKPVVPNQFWILQKNNEKIGNVEACAGGYQVKINNTVSKYKTIRMAAQRAEIHFERDALKHEKPVANLVHGYPAHGRVFNAIWDVPHKLPLFTKTRKSKSWFAAGWYRVCKNKNWRIIQDPKLITLERYPYKGPYKSQQEVE